MKTYYNVIYNSVHGVWPQAKEMSDSSIIMAAHNECNRQGTNLQEFAEIALITDEDGNFDYSRPMTPQEEFNAAIKKLGDDGRLFEVYTQDDEGILAFLKRCDVIGIKEKKS